MPGDVLDKMNAMQAPAETLPEDPPKQQSTSDDAEAGADSAPVGTQSDRKDSGSDEVPGVPCVPAIPPSWTCADAGNTSCAVTPSGETATIPGTPEQDLVDMLDASFNEPTAPWVSSKVSDEDTCPAAEDGAAAPAAPEHSADAAEVAVPGEGDEGAKIDKISKGSKGSKGKGSKGGKGGKGGKGKAAKRGKHGK